MISSNETTAFSRLETSGELLVRSVRVRLLSAWQEAFQLVLWCLHQLLYWPLTKCVQVFVYMRSWLVSGMYSWWLFWFMRMLSVSRPTLLQGSYCLCHHLASFLNNPSAAHQTLFHREGEKGNHTEVETTALFRFVENLQVSFMLFSFWNWHRYATFVFQDKLHFGTGHIVFFEHGTEIHFFHAIILGVVFFFQQLNSFLSCNYTGRCFFSTVKFISFCDSKFLLW